MSIKKKKIALSPASAGIGDRSSTRKTSRLRRWLRRLFYLGAGLVLLLLILRFAVFVSFPWILENTAEGYDLTCTYERMDLSFLTGKLKMRHLIVAPIEGGEPFLDVEYLFAEVEFLPLLTGDFVVNRLEADGVDLVVEREADGTFPFLQRIEQAEKEEAGEPPDLEDQLAEMESLEDIDFTLPLEITALRLQHVHVLVRDQSVQPPVDTRLDLNLRISDLGSKTRQVRLDCNLSIPKILDALRIEAGGTSAGKSLRADLEIRLRGFHPEPVTGYLTLLGIRPSADSISFGLQASIETEAVAPETEGIKGFFSLGPIRIDADGAESLALDSVRLEGNEISRKHAVFSNLEIVGGRARAAMLASGALRIGGLEFHGSPAEPDRVREPEPEDTDPEEARPGTEYAWALNEILLSGFHAWFTDETVEPGAELNLQLNRLSIRDFESTRPDQEVSIAAQISAPGIVESIRLNGRSSPFARRRTLDLELSASEIDPQALRPYLDRSHVESMFESGTLDVKLHAAAEPHEGGRWDADFSLSDLSLKDGEELFGLDRFSIGHAGIDPERNSFSVETVEINGIRGGLHREASGALKALGFRIHEPPPRPVEVARSRSADPSATSGGAASVRPPRIAINHFLWDETRIHFLDDSAKPPIDALLADGGVEIKNLLVDFDPHAPAPKPSAIRAWFVVPDLVEQLQIEGVLLASPATPSLDLDLVGEGITRRALTPYLDAAGMECSFEKGGIKLNVKADLGLAGQAIAGAVSIRDLAFEGGGEELLGVDAVRIEGIHLGPDAVQVEALEVDRPRARVSRDEEGVLAICGLRFPPGSAPGETNPPVQAISGSKETERMASSGEAPPAIPMALDRLRVNGVEFRWSDSALISSLQQGGVLDLAIDDLKWGSEPGPIPFEISLRVPESLEKLLLSGTVRAAPDAFDLMMVLDGTGMRAGALAAYLPEGATLDLEDGRLHAKIDVGFSAHEEGGRRAGVVLSEIDFRDGAESEPLLEIESIRSLISRFDPDENVLAVEEISLNGLSTVMERTAGGGMRFLGLHIEPIEGPVEEERVETVPAKDLVPSLPLPELTGALREARPLITVQKIDLNIDRFKMIDRTGPEDRPAITTELHIRNQKPIQLLGTDPESSPPAELELHARVESLVDSLTLSVTAAPCALKPDLDLDLRVDGIHGDRLVDFFPAIEETIDGSLLTDGRLQGRLDVTLNTNRRDPLDFDFSKAFGLNVLLEDFEYRNGPDGDVLAGLKELYMDVSRVNTSTGYVRIRTLEVQKPMGIVSREEDGLHVMGLVLKSTQEQAQNSAENGSQDVREESNPVAAEGPQNGSSPVTESGSEIRLDRFYMTDIDFTFQDISADPPMIIPLTGLDIDVREFTTRAFTEPHPIYFNMLLNSGEVPLPVREKTGFVSGVFGGALSMVTGGGDEPVDMENRPFFEEIGLRGKIALNPELHGWIKTSVDVLELANLKGPVKDNGVTLNDGTLDADVDLLFHDDGSLDASAKFTFTDLDVSESANGPIQRYLRLPAPLDAVQFVLRDENGTITVPLDFHVGAEGMSAGRITATAASTFTKLVSSAIASSPFRVVGTGLDIAGSLGGFLPLGGTEEPEVKDSDDAVALFFDPGVVHLTRFEELSLEPVVERLNDDDDLVVTLSHVLGGGDIVRAHIRANPSMQECQELVSRLRKKKREILMDRAEAASRTRAAFAAGFQDEAAAARRLLRAQDRELGLVERALDQVLELLKPGAERLQKRRTRNAGTAIANHRLGAIRNFLLEQDIDGIKSRVRVSRPRFMFREGTEGGWVTISFSRKKAR